MNEPVVSMLSEEVDEPVDEAVDAVVDDAVDAVVDDAVEESVEEVVSESSAPDRADAPVSVITERFLKTVVEHVSLDRIEELHLFSPLRQGGVETGIAVIAARVLVPISLATDGAELPFDGETTVAPPVRERHTVYTARYRLVQKGPERGKWEADVVAEAEAPLITVETVVRGVQRRAGEESEILRFTAKQIAYALHVPWPLAVEPVVVEPVAAEPEAAEPEAAELEAAEPEAAEPVTDSNAT